jgi:hypothetical protein
MVLVRIRHGLILHVYEHQVGKPDNIRLFERCRSLRKWKDNIVTCISDYRRCLDLYIDLLITYT